MHAVLLQKERLAIHAVVHTTLQMALERGVGESEVPKLLQEMRGAMDQALDHIAKELGLKSTPVPAPPPPVPAMVFVAPPALVPVHAQAPVPPPFNPPQYRAPLGYVPAPVFAAKLEPSAPELPATPTAPRAHAKRILIKRTSRRLVLPDEILLNIFQRLLPPPRDPNVLRLRDPGGCFAALIVAASVCEDWRAVATRRPQLWSRLDGLSFGELCALPELFARSTPLPIDVDIDMRADKRYRNGEIANALANNMYRMRSLAIRVNIGHTAAWWSLQKPLQVEAPLLEAFEVQFAPGFKLTERLFMHHAPRLTRVTLDPDVLTAPLSETMQNVVAVDARANQGMPEALARLLFTTCPKLRTLILGAPLNDAKTLLQTHTPNRDTRAHPGAFYSHDRNLDRLEIALLPGDDCVPTLQLFNHKHIAYIHIRGGDALLFEFVRRRVREARNLCIGRARLALRDAQKYERVFSELPPAALGHVLGGAPQLFGTLESLTVWERLPGEAFRALLAQRVPALRKLSVLVRPETDGVALWDALRRGRWELPALQTLRLTSQDVSGAFAGAPGCTPSVRARDVLDLVRDGLWYKARRLRDVVLDDVVFAEGMCSPLVDELRAFTDDLYLC